MLHGLLAPFEPSDLVVVASPTRTFPKTLRRWRRGASSVSNNLTRMAVCMTYFKSINWTQSVNGLPRMAQGCVIAGDAGVRHSW